MALKSVSSNDGEAENTDENKTPVLNNLSITKQVLEENPVTANNEEIIKPLVVEEAKPIVSRKSIRPEITLDNLIDPSVENQDKKYNFRARRSDLIKWESPSTTKSPKRTVTKGIFTLPNFNSTIAEGRKFIIKLKIKAPYMYKYV